MPENHLRYNIDMNTKVSCWCIPMSVLPLGKIACLFTEWYYKMIVLTWWMHILMVCVGGCVCKNHYVNPMASSISDSSHYIYAKVSFPTLKICEIMYKHSYNKCVAHTHGQKQRERERAREWKDLSKGSHEIQATCCQWQACLKKYFLEGIK